MNGNKRSVIEQPYSIPRSLAAQNPVEVELEFLPSKTSVKTIVGKNIIDLAKSAGVTIPYQCRKGECKKCEIIFEGTKVLACKTKATWTSTPSSKNWELVCKGYGGSGCVGYDNGNNASLKKISVIVPATKT